MKTRFLNKMAGLLAVLLLFSCTGKFEEYNTDNTGFTDGQKTYDYNTFGVWLKVVQMGIYLIMIGGVARTGISRRCKI